MKNSSTYIDSYPYVAALSCHSDVIADPGFKIKGKSKKKQNPEETGVKGGISMLRRELMGEEVKEVVVTPVKETVTAGKALLGLGQRLTHWIGGLVRAH